MNWAYGVTTTYERVFDLLPATLRSLHFGGFDDPRIFMDGYSIRLDSTKSIESPVWLGKNTTMRYPKVGAIGNWILALWELYIRNPEADRFVIFQDDLVCYKNLRQYLERREMMSDACYYNLYTVPCNEAIIDGVDCVGRWFLSDQLGRGALALYFNRLMATTLLAQQAVIFQPQNTVYGTKSIDGMVSTAFKNIGWKEFVHYPSLVQHAGKVSSLGHLLMPVSESFRGENFDALELLK